VRFITVATAVLCAALLAPVANATKPDRWRIAIGDPPYVELPGDFEFCPASIAPDGVSVEVIGGNHAISDFASGRSMVTGRHVDRFTNLANGKSVTVELQGRATFVPQDDGSANATLSGVLGYNFWPGDEGPGDTTVGRTYVFTGSVDLVYESSGVVSAFSSTAQMVDVCALLAD
jgi:hypothetical protein